MNIIHKHRLLNMVINMNIIHKHRLEHDIPTLTLKSK